MSSLAAADVGGVVHPTPKGSLLAALVIAHVLTGRDVMQAPEIADGALLRDAAAEVVSRHRVGGRQ